MSASSTASQIVTTTNAKFVAELESCLTANGFTPDEITSIRNFYSSILSAEDLAALTAVVDAQFQQIKKVADKISNAHQSDVILGAVQNNGKRLVQDAPQPFSLPEPAAPLTNKATAPVFQQASDSFKDDYPSTYGKIDEAGNWFRVNKSSGLVEFVHSSGTSIKINKAGDVSVNIRGSLQWLVNGDSVTNVMGNMDLGVLGSLVQQVLSGMDIKVNGLLDISATDGVTSKGGTIKFN